MSGDERATGRIEAQDASDAKVKTDLPAVHQNASFCNIYQSIIPGLDPKALQHKQLSPRQMAAIYLLLQGLSEIEVAGRLGINRTTIYRWRSRGAAFREELDAQRRGLWQQANDRLGAMVTPALNLLQRQLNDAQTVVDARIATHVASTVLRLALRHPPAEPPAADELARERQRGYDAALLAYINAPMPGRARKSAAVHRPSAEEEE